MAVIREFLDALSGNAKPKDTVHHYIAGSDEALRRHILHYEIAFPRFALISQDMYTMGNCVMVHLCMRGIHAGDLWSLPPMGMQVAPPLRPTHTGDFMGLAPTRQQINLPVMVLYRISNDTIVEHRMRYNVDDLLRQLGLSPRRRHNTSEMGECRGLRIPLWIEVAQVNHS